MASRTTWVLRVLTTALLSLSLITLTRSASAKETSKGPAGWCGESAEALPSDVCYIDGRKHGERRTLVIWLHGVIAKNTNWSHNHQRMLKRVAGYAGVEMLFPRGLPADSVYAWPGTTDSQDKNEAALIDQWMTAKAALEKREQRSFDEVFVFGFSSGAYFTSSLAMRGRVDVDGYAVFAGGQPMAARPQPVVHFSPVFVGVCANDASTATHSRAFAASLAGAGIPRMVSEQKVGHDLSEVHFIQALGYLRGKVKARVAMRSVRVTGV